MGKKTSTDTGLFASNLTVTYKNGTEALKDASFSLPNGTITGLVGVNGSGKSTLFKAIMGFIPLKNGEISLQGNTIKAALKEGIIAYVPQSEEVDWNFPVLVEDVVMMGRYGKMGFPRIVRQKDKEMVSEALEKVGMVDLRKRQIGELSGGQKKRVFLARSLAQDAKIILLDEPFSGVDVTTEEAIITLLRRLRDEGCIILVSTHNLGSVPEFCDRTVLINRTILAQGLTKEVFTPDNLKRAFGGVLRHFVLGGTALHNDDDTRQVTVITDDERPFVVYGDETKQYENPSND